MARFAQKGHKSHSAQRPGGSATASFATDPSLPLSQGVHSVIFDHKSVSTLLTLWPNKALAVQDGCRPPPPRPKHIPIELSPYQILQVPSFNHSFEALPPRKPTASSRLPRHVPIVIPDFAQPFIPEPVSNPQAVKLSDAPLNPTVRLNQAKVSLTHANLPEGASPGDTAKAIEAPLNDHTKPLAMNSSQLSLSTASESGTESISIPLRPVNQADNGNGSLGIISPISPGGAAANLSGLVCNVHGTTGEVPHGLVGATTTILGDKLYVFGGRNHTRNNPRLTSDLYELDLLRRHWTKLEVSGDVPPPRYFHSVCALGDSKLVCYGGMSPAPHLRGSQDRPAQATEGQSEVVVMSDIHIYDVPKRKWFLVADSATSTSGPQGRYAHCAAILPSSAVFSSSTAPHSAIQHNRPSSDGGSAHSGSLGVQLDGAGGAEMIVVGGQDSANNYIEQISVFNLRSLKWTSTTSYDHKCGAYKSMVAPLTGIEAENIGRGSTLEDPSKSRSGTSTLIYSNYNFLEVKLELQVRLPDGTLIERPMKGRVSPPGLRFPNGGIINNHFVVSGTYLTSSKHEYALWALDLRTLTWGRIETAGSVFSQASWNRGILWNRRNTFVILGHRKRNLVDDYNHRRINFNHVCMVELEAFGLYENPRKTSPSSAYVSMSSPAIPASIQPSVGSNAAGGRQMSQIAEQLGQTALSIYELSDMELVAMDGERIACNSHILAQRWGPYFYRLLQESTNGRSGGAMSDTTTLRSQAHSQTSRNSILTITPSGANGPDAASLSESVPESERSVSQSTNRTLVEQPPSTSASASYRPRALFLPHTTQTIRLLLYYLYTSALPPLSSTLCSPHTLCSLLQMARPYQIDGLLEATVQRLHEVLDGRNAAAVFNAAAMAAGGGRGTRLSDAFAAETDTTAGSDKRPTSLDQNTLTVPTGQGHSKSNSLDGSSTPTEESFPHGDDGPAPKDKGKETWSGEMSSVIGLQKRGLRGLMEGRRLRERANTGGIDL